jgi:hypothetical protein
MLAQAPKSGTARFIFGQSRGFCHGFIRQWTCFHSFVQAPCAVATGRAAADDDVVNAIVMAWNDLSP